MTDVVGYVSQCELCGQRAITLEPHGSDWTCPRCAEVAEPSPYAVESIHGRNCQCPRTPDGMFACDDDEFPYDAPDLRKIRG